MVTSCRAPIGASFTRCCTKRVCGSGLESGVSVATQSRASSATEKDMPLPLPTDVAAGALSLRDMALSAALVTDAATPLNVQGTLQPVLP